jgi:hypothetical protein
LLKSQIIQIHNIETQNIVQSLTIQSEEPAVMLNFSVFPLDLYINSTVLSPIKSEYENLAGGHIQVILTFKTKIMALRMIPLEVQVDQYFTAGKIEEAVVLIEQMVIRELIDIQNVVKF